MKHGVNEDQGSITVLAVIILVILTILGISVSNISNTDIWISRNEAISENDYYIAEGGIRREAQELGSGNYKVKNIYNRNVLATQNSTGIPGPRPHTVMGEPYNFSLEYIGFFLPAKGFSAKTFSRYDYTIDVRKNSTGIRARYYTIGPKVDQ